MKKVRDDIYQVMHGFKPLKRGERRKGQSEWYYLDPRYKDDDAQKEIDVFDGEAPNPRLGRILSDDMQKNPDDYYIWRTKGDDKVRDRHKERDGKVFNWHIPPTGGHPGEDYNCRCWAEPYVPQKSEHKRLQIDLSGLHPLDELKPTKFDSKDATLYAANDKANMASDAVYVSSDEDLYARMWENIKEQEEVVLYPYLDTKGFITIGAGVNVDDWNVFKNLNVTVGGISATEEQKWEAYLFLRQMSDDKDGNGNYINRNLRATAFENKTNIRISDAEARSLAQHHMTKDLAHLRKEFTDFDSFPLSLKEVLLDIQYNTGNLNQHDWPQLYRAIKNHDINGIIANVRRKDVQQSRNDWAQMTARSIRF